jgi:alpha-galactosidase
MKIVLIGAGSRSFGLGQVVDVMWSRELRGRGVTFTLVDENAEALDQMTRVARRVKKLAKTDIKIESTTDRRTALPGANYVVIAVARKRFDLWEQDFRVPLAYGFNHVLGENGGPGAVFHALRSFGLIIPICRDVEKLCPDALVLNFTNPEARVLHAICHLTRVKAIGICHGVFGALDRVSKYVGKPEKDLDIISAGMNHFYCILRVKDRKTGKNLLPMVLKKAANDMSHGNSPIFRKFAQIFDVFTFPSEDHIGEYLAFGSEFHGTAWPYGREKNMVHVKDVVPRDVFAEYAAGKRPLNDPAIPRASYEHTVPIICDIELDRGTLRPAVNVLNTGGYIENLPRDVVVEIPGRADAQGVHPLSVGAIPEAFAAFMRPQFTIHGLVTEAYRTRSKKLLLQALLLDPCVNSITRAEKMLDEMLKLQSEFLPSFT